MAPLKRCAAERLFQCGRGQRSESHGLFQTEGEGGACGQHGNLTIDQEVESQALLRSLILHSGRYTIAPYGAFAVEIESKSLSARRIVGPEIRQSVNAIYPASLPASVERSVGQIVQLILNEAPLPPDAINLVSIAAE